MRYIKLETGYTNEPVIDLDRILSFQAFEKGGDNKGSLSVRFFGNENADFSFKTNDLAEQAYADMCYLLNVVSSATAVIQTPKPLN